MELFKLRALHGAEMWINPAHIVAVRTDWYSYPQAPQAEVVRITRVSVVDDGEYVDARTPEDFLADLRLFGLVPLK